MDALRKLVPDGFLTALLVAGVLGSVAPAAGGFALALDRVVYAAIVVLFFLHGLRLSRESVVQGVVHWRLHLAILVLTFGAYPLLAFGLSKAMPGLLPADLWAGVIFLACVPSTVQSSISLIAIARGNVPGAVAQAAASNMLGVLLTPAAAGLAIALHGASVPLSGIGGIAVQLLLPFALGQLFRPVLLKAAEPHFRRMALIDKATIVLVVYSAFSAAARAGIWDRLTWPVLVPLVGVCLLLLALGMAASAAMGRIGGFGAADRTTIFYAGTLKSLATGVPMMQVLLPASQIGLAVVPLMIFHQAQLAVCTWLAGRAARTPPPPS